MHKLDYIYISMILTSVPKQAPELDPKSTYDLNY